MPKLRAGISQPARSFVPKRTRIRFVGWTLLATLVAGFIVVLPRLAFSPATAGLVILGAMALGVPIFVFACRYDDGS